MEVATRNHQIREARTPLKAQSFPTQSFQGRSIKSGGHGTRTRSPFRGTSVPVRPLTNSLTLRDRHSACRLIATRSRYSDVFAPLISLMNSSLVSKRANCFVSCSIASHGCMLLSVLRSMVTAS